MSVIRDPKPLDSEFSPDELLYRESESEIVQSCFDDAQNLHISGPCGSGKTALVKQAAEASITSTCYISCIRYDTQYAVLKQILRELVGEPVESGHHTSELQRRLQTQTVDSEIVVVLDDFDFLLLNNGDDLLYFLCQQNSNVGLVLVTADDRDLRDQIEERTYSRLQPRQLGIRQYTEQETYEILADRAEESLEPRSLRRDALNYISSTTQNVAAGLMWLQHSARTAENVITSELVEELEGDAERLYVENKLEPFSKHHRLVYQATEKLTTVLAEEEPSIRTGEIYETYEQLCEARNTDPLSGRRISDHLKQLEELRLITANYHYGGNKGKTREIQRQSVFSC